MVLLTVVLGKFFLKQNLKSHCEIYPVAFWVTRIVSLRKSSNLFKEDVEAYLKREGGISADDGVKRIENSYRTYKVVEQQMLAQKARCDILSLFIFRIGEHQVFIYTCRE